MVKIQIYKIKHSVIPGFLQTYYFIIDFIRKSMVYRAM